MTRDKKPRPLTERLLAAADRWEPLTVGKLCREAALALAQAAPRCSTTAGSGSKPS